MAGLIRPRAYALRKITETAQRLGRVFQQRRYPDHGGFTGPGKWTSGVTSEFKVEAPTSIRTGESEARGRE